MCDACCSSHCSEHRTWDPGSRLAGAEGTGEETMVLFPSPESSQSLQLLQQSSFYLEPPTQRTPGLKAKLAGVQGGQLSSILSSMAKYAAPEVQPRRQDSLQACLSANACLLLQISVVQHLYLPGFPGPRCSSICSLNTAFRGVPRNHTLAPFDLPQVPSQHLDLLKLPKPSLLYHSPI